MPKHSRKRHRSRSSSEDRNSLIKMVKRLERRLSEVERNDRYRHSKPPIPSSASSSSSRSVMRSIHRNSKENGETESEGTSGREDKESVAAESVVRQGEMDLEIALVADEPVEGAENRPLNVEYLSVLGDDIVPGKASAAPLQCDIAGRWCHVLKNGLKADTRKKLMSKYPPPKNCIFLASPQLNPEVKAAISESVVRRDVRLSQLQEQVGAGLAAIGIVISSLLKEREGDNKMLVEALSDAGRLLSEVHYSESLSRRELIALNLNKELNETLTNTPVDEWLFGGGLEDRIKAAKSLERSSRELKATKKPFNKPAGTLKQLNFKSPPQHIQGVRQGGQNFRQAPQTSHYKQYRGASSQRSRKPEKPRLTKRQSYP